MMPLIDQFPKEKLTREQEAALSARIKGGDEDATNELVLATMREALLYTGRTSHGEIGDDMRVSLCYQRLMRAAKRFDPAQGRFFAFAKAALRGVMQTYWEDKGTVRNAKSTVSLDGLSGWSGANVDISQRAPYRPAFASGNSDDAAPSQDVREVATGEVTEPEFDLIFARDKWFEIQKLVAHKINSRQRMVLSLIYRGGLNCPEIGKLIGVTRSRVHAIHREAIKIIRDTLASKKRLLEAA